MGCQPVRSELIEHQLGARHSAERLQSQQTGERMGSRPSAAGGGGAPAPALRPADHRSNQIIQLLPGDEFLFVTVTERMSGLSRPGWANKTSAGLTSATDARTTRLRRPQRPSSTQVRAAVCGLPTCGEGVEALFVLARPFRSRVKTRPATPSRANAAASTASHRTFMTIAIRPSVG